MSIKKNKHNLVLIRRFALEPQYLQAMRDRGINYCNTRKKPCTNKHYNWPLVSRQLVRQFVYNAFYIRYQPPRCLR